jgi:hypothetical protein
MPEDEIKSEVRLYAVESLAATLFAMLCLMNAGDPRADIAEVRRQTIDGARLRAFPELDDPVTSDLYSAELESAVDRLMEMATEQIDAILEARRRRMEGS